MLALGIDFGTSTTVAAAYRDGTPVVIKNADQQEVTPSCIAFQPNGTMAIGSAAKRRRTIDPANALYSVKRILGQTWQHPEVREFREQYPFDLVQGGDDIPRFATRAGQFTAVELASRILGVVRGSPELAGATPERVTLTVPACFDERQKQALKEAAAMAGFPACEIIDEPCAAALSYLEGNDENRTVVVYDLGGGTFDLTVMRWAGEEYMVLGEGGDSYADYTLLSTVGDPYLGGDDVDQSCAAWIHQQVLEQHRWDIRSDATSFQKLLLECEAAKMFLSLTDSHRVDLSAIDEVLRDKSVEVTRAQLQRLCLDLVRRTFVICDEALARAAVSVADVDLVILSGGSCHMPMIQQGVGSYFQRAPQMSVQPDRAVALGAALHAGRSL